MSGNVRTRESVRYTVSQQLLAGTYILLLPPRFQRLVPPLENLPSNTRITLIALFRISRIFLNSFGLFAVNVFLVIFIRSADFGGFHECVRDVDLTESGTGVNHLEELESVVVYRWLTLTCAVFCNNRS